MESNLDLYREWLGFLKEVELFFNDRGFLKVETPTLVPSGAMESTLEAFKLEGEDLYLPTSPEFSLKKLWLSGLSEKLYEISKSFRSKEELGDMHLSEFTMLEFYMAHQSFHKMKETTAEFLTSALGLKPSDVSYIKLDECFKSFTGFELKPESDKAFLKSVATFHNLHFTNEYSWNDLYQVIYLNLIEPLLSRNSLVFLENYPPQLSALAKINKEGWASRFEVYYKGVELGNAYDELMDVKELQGRWSCENKIRFDDGRPSHPIDETLIQITDESFIKAGVGIAIGLERLFSLISDRNSIKVWPF